MHAFNKAQLHLYKTGSAWTWWLVEWKPVRPIQQDHVSKHTHIYKEKRTYEQERTV